MGFASGPGSQLKICRAVLEAGVERFFPWQFGVDYDVIGRGSAQTLFGIGFLVSSHIIIQLLFLIRKRVPVFPKMGR
jgi:hypothetical protein